MAASFVSYYAERDFFQRNGGSSKSAACFRYTMFNSPQLKGVAQEVEDTIVKIMKEAAAG
jgi:hypothetical protein